MYAERRKLWADALRSGKYKQGGGMLCKTLQCQAKLDNPFLYCCLGVLCEVYMQAGNELRISTSESGLVKLYNQSPGDPPTVVLKWIGLSTSSLANGATLRNKHNGLMCANDAGVSFAEIADFIENSPENLFLTDDARKELNDAN